MSSGTFRLVRFKRPAAASLTMLDQSKPGLLCAKLDVSSKMILDDVLNQVVILLLLKARGSGA